MSSFDRFKDVNKKRIVANQDSNASFVFNAYNTTTISQVNTTGRDLTASVVNLQEKDLAYIYVSNQEDLEIGSVWTAKTLHWLIAEEIIVIKDVHWRKYLAFLCNVALDGAWGYFKGPEKTFIDVSLKDRAILQSQQHPILIMQTGTLKVGDRIMAGGRGWLVQEKDNISTSGIDYYSLVQTTMAKEYNKETHKLEPQEDGSIEDKNYITPTFIEQPVLKDNVYSVAPNQLISLTTEEGYFKTSNQIIEIVKHNATTIQFKIPFGVRESIVIQVKEQGQVVSKTYKAVN